VSFHSPGHVSHDDERPHVEIDQEVFVLLQGSGWIEVDGSIEEVCAGDVVLIEPGEDHHLISGVEDPFVNLWLHAK
jgi:mannose-6-phosphate isomerase-like protein (cupin superfamily)